MSKFKSNKLKFYVARVNMGNGTEQIVHQDNFTRLFVAREDISNSPGFPEARIANIVANYFNNINTELGQEFYYYVVRVTEDSRVIMGQMPEDAAKWFADEEEPVDEPVEEPIEEPPTDESGE